VTKQGSYQFGDMPQRGAEALEGLKLGISSFDTNYCCDDLGRVGSHANKRKDVQTGPVALQQLLLSIVITFCQRSASRELKCVDRSSCSSELWVIEN